MIRKYLMPLLAVFGIYMGIRTVISGSSTPPPGQPVVEPPLVDYENFVAGSGIVEAASENIAIASQLPGIVTEIHVRLGQQVKVGDPLFSIAWVSLLARSSISSLYKHGILRTQSFFLRQSATKRRQLHI